MSVRADTSTRMPMRNCRCVHLTVEIYDEHTAHSLRIIAECDRCSDTNVREDTKPLASISKRVVRATRDVCREAGHGDFGGRIATDGMHCGDSSAC